MTIDEPTLTSVLGLAALTASAMFFALALFARQIPGVRFWALGSLAVGFAMVADGPRVIADWRIASMLFNIPFSVGQAFILAGTLQFCARPHAGRVLWVLALLAIGMATLFTFAVPDTTWRIGSLSAYQALINIWTAVILWKYPDAFSRGVFRIASVVALVQASAATAQGMMIALSASAISYASPELPLANLISWGGTMLNVLVGSWMLFLLIMLRLIADLRLAAERDLLTGLLNRRGLRLHIDSILLRSGGGNASIGVMIVDVDHFKRINDTHGHDLGDRVLVVMGQVLLDLATPSVTPSRWGGEEFCILVEGPARSTLTELADAIRTRFRQETAALPGLSGGASVSIGIAMALENRFDISDVIAAADAQLYLAKQNGRDRVAMAA